MKSTESQEKNKRESLIQQEIMLAISKNPLALVVRRNVGKFLTVYGNLQRAISILKLAGIISSEISIGQVGESDLQGIIGGQKCPNCKYSIHPLPYAVEVKDADGEQSPGQVLWQKEKWERRGGLYVLARSVSDLPPPLIYKKI